jgi:CPA1 family monovalent cation:H+ antiporter
MWGQMWEALDYIANAVLFLLIGLVIGPGPLLDNAGPILLAAVVVLAARALAVVPVVWLLERVAHIPRLGRRNEAVLIWGGLRGGVALALALALPEELAERELLVALTGGVVLATLLLNATSIRWLVSRLGLDQPSDADQYVMAIAHMSAVEAARREMTELGLDPDPRTEDISARRAGCTEEMDRLDVGEDDEFRIVVGRGLHVERRTYQWLSDEGLLPPAVTRTLLHEVDDEIDDLSLHAGGHELGSSRAQRSGGLEQLTRRLVGWLPNPRAAIPRSWPTRRRRHDDSPPDAPQTRSTCSTTSRDPAGDGGTGPKDVPWLGARSDQEAGRARLPVGPPATGPCTPGRSRR